MVDLKSRIVELWNSGFTAGEIALEFKVTRNKVMGIINRSRAAGLITRFVPKTQPKLKIPKRKATQKTIDVPIITSNKRKTLFDLKLYDCRWIDDDTGYCGDPVKPKTSWCCKHYDIVYIKNSNIKSLPT